MSCSSKSTIYSLDGESTVLVGACHKCRISDPTSTGWIRICILTKSLTETMNKSLLLVDKFRIDKYYILKENV